MDIPTTNTCIACSKDAFSEYLKGLLRCNNCGHVFADVRLEDDELVELYRRNYFFGEEYSNYLKDKNVIQDNFKRRISVLERYTHNYNHHTLIEIGSAYGFFLDLVRDKFETVGFDITEDGVRYARETLGLNVFQESFLTHDFNNKTYDIACMWDTIEHLRDPQLFIEKIGKITRSGSLFAMTTGDIASSNARRSGENWRLIHPPTHLHYFTQQSARTLLERNGFDVIYSKHCGFSRSADNALYNVLVIRRNQLRLYNIIKKLGLINWSFYLNLYDIMYVIARKR